MTIDRPRLQVNRALVVIRYKQPYIDWVKSTGELPFDNMTLEDANEDSEAFLIPSYDCSVDPVDGTEEAVKWVEKRWRVLFDHILGSWMPNQDEWPQKRTLKMFREWFDVEYQSLVWDMGNEPLEIDEWDDEELDEEDLSEKKAVLH